jgi:hypothetical protein
MKYRESQPLAKSPKATDPIKKAIKIIDKAKAQAGKAVPIVREGARSAKRGADKLISAPSRFGRKIKNTVKDSTRRYF